MRSMLPEAADPFRPKGHRIQTCNAIWIGSRSETASCRATRLNAPHRSPNKDVRRYFEKRLDTTTRSVEFSTDCSSGPKTCWCPPPPIPRRSIRESTAAV